VKGLRRWLRRRQSPGELARVLEKCSKQMHPADVSRVYLCLYQVQHRGNEADQSALRSCVGELLERYDHDIPEIHQSIEAIQSELGPGRGPRVLGSQGAFRRGDAVCRRLSSGNVEDAVIREFEPSSDHSRRFGRMAGVQVVEADGVSRLDRWFLDSMVPAAAYGRPW